MTLLIHHLWRRLRRLWGQNRIRLSAEEARELVAGEGVRGEGEHGVVETPLVKGR